VTGAFQLCPRSHKGLVLQPFQSMSEPLRRIMIIGDNMQVFGRSPIKSHPETFFGTNRVEQDTKRVEETWEKSKAIRVHYPGLGLHTEPCKKRAHEI
jgi:hypothetical protein